MKTPVLAGRKRSGEGINGAPDQLSSSSEAASESAPSRPGPIAPAPTLAAPKRRRRPALIAAGLILVILGALGAYYLTQQSAERIAVVGMAREVAWGETLAADDFVQVQIVSDPNLRPVPWAAASSLIGKIAIGDLRPGMLITPDSFTSDPIPPTGFALVGVQVDAGQLPVTTLPPQAKVLLVPTQGGGGATQVVATAIAPTEASIYTIGPIEASGKRTVDVIVPIAFAPNLAAEAVAGRVAIVLLPVG